jgi:hypothetical protein
MGMQGDGEGSMSFAGKRMAFFVLVAAVTALAAAALVRAGQSSDTVPAGVRITQDLDSNGPLKQINVEVAVDRQGGPGPQHLDVEAHAWFNREAPPHGLPAHNVDITVQKLTIHGDDTFTPGDGFDFLWPPLDRVCRAALEAC